MKALKCSALAAGVALFSACASTGFVSTWKAPDAKPFDASGQKVAAIVMMKDIAPRRAAEDALARELTTRGVTGVPMYSILPEGSPDNEAAARAALEKAGVAGAVVMRPVGKDKEIVATPSMYMGPMYGGYYGGYYGAGWGAPYGGTDIRTNTIVSIETLVYSLPQNKLVWGGQSKTTNPSNVDGLVKETVEAAARELKKQGLVPK